MKTCPTCGVEHENNKDHDVCYICCILAEAEVETCS